MTTHMINGRFVELRSNPDGSVDTDQLRKLGGIPDGSPLIHQLPDGSNRVINPGEKVRIPANQYFTHMPAHIRGGWPD
jgi:hypothetical protein